MRHPHGSKPSRLKQNKVSWLLRPKCTALLSSCAYIHHRRFVHSVFTHSAKRIKTTFALTANFARAFHYYINTSPLCSWGVLSGTIKPYKKHVLVCAGGSADTWPSEVDDDPGSFVTQLCQAIKKKKDSIGYNVKVTITDEISTKGDGSGTDIILFPDMIKLIGVRRDQLDDLVKQLFVEQSKPVGFAYERVDFKGCVLVCAHKLRDKRCGIIGPILSNEFDIVLREKSLEDAVKVFKVCSAPDIQSSLV